MFFNSLMEMTSSVADIICIAQITFKLINNTLPANDGWFPLLNSKLLANVSFQRRVISLIFVTKCISKRLLKSSFQYRIRPAELTNHSARTN